jgi:hypothetical protein
MSMDKPTREELDEDMHAEIDAAIDRYRSDGDVLALKDAVSAACAQRGLT